MISGGQQTPPVGQAPGGAKGTGLAPNVASLLCYICSPLTGLVFLLIEKENDDVKFHAWQSLVFGLGYIVVLIMLEILAAIMGLVASVLGIIVGFFVPVVILASIVLWIVCMVKAYQGERWRIPVVGDFAAKKAGVV